MPDREKTALGIREMIMRDTWRDIDADRQRYQRILNDALALLKEQEAVEPDTDSEGTCSCGNCGETVGWFPVGCSTPNKLCKFCPECGQAVKWE